MNPAKRNTPKSPSVTAKIVDKSVHSHHDALGLPPRESITTMSNSKRKLTRIRVARGRPAGVALLTVATLVNGTLWARDAGAPQTERRDVNDSYFDVTVTDSKPSLKTVTVWAFTSAGSEKVSCPRASV